MLNDETAYFLTKWGGRFQKMGNFMGNLKITTY